MTSSEYHTNVVLERLGTDAQMRAEYAAAADLPHLDRELLDELRLTEILMGWHRTIGAKPTVNAEGWRRLQEHTGSDSDQVRAVYDGDILRLQLDEMARQMLQSGGAGENTPLRLEVIVEAPLRDPDSVPVLSEADAVLDPTVHAAVTTAAGGGTPEPIPIEAWELVANRIEGDTGNTFRYGDVWIDAAFDTVEDVDTRSVQVLPVRIAGAMMLVLAVLIVHRLYRARRGPWLNVSHTKGAAISDVIGLLVGTVMCAGAPAAAIARLLDVRNPLADLGSTDTALFAGVFGLVVGVPIMSLWASMFAPSWVTVDSDGITQKGMILRSYVGWDELEKINVEERVVRGRDRMGNPTESGSIRLQVLELESESGVITVLPPPRRVRLLFIERMLEHVPEHHRELLEEHFSAWR